MSDLRGTIANITRNVTKTSGDLLKTTKLGMNLSAEEGNLRNLHYEIGRKVHEIYQYGGSLGKFFDEKYLEIEACERKIAEIKEQIGVIKGTRDCPKCGKKVERESEFCPKCGIRLMEAGMAASAAAPSPVSVDSAAMVDHVGLQIPPHSAAPPEAPPPPAAIPAAPAPPPAPIPNEKFCRICGSKNESTTKFCLSCGRILE